MSKRVIEFELTAESVDRAIKAIQEYRRWFEDRMKALRKAVAERIRWSADSGFSTAIVSDVIKGPPDVNNVSVRVDDRENVTVVIADGTKAVFIEFGAGIYHNTGAGGSLHPWVTGGSDNPRIQEFTIGSYGQGKGGWQDSWGFYLNGDKSNGVSVTRGTPAAMPMYKGAKEAVFAMRDIVEEVFGG